MELLQLKKTLPRSPLARGQSGMSSQREQQLTRDLRDAEEEIASLRRKLRQQVGVFCVVVERASSKKCVVPLAHENSTATIRSKGSVSGGGLCAATVCAASHTVWGEYMVGVAVVVQAAGGIPQHQVAALTWLRLDMHGDLPVLLHGALSSSRCDGAKLCRNACCRSGSWHRWAEGQALAMPMQRAALQTMR